jgi:hypothetical protein
MKEFNKELVLDSANVILNLEYLGVHFEDVKEERSKHGFFTKMAYYYSVPESSTIEVDNEELNTRIKTADGLKRLAKDELIAMFVKVYGSELGEDKEFLDYMKNNTSDYLKFYAKVRKGEVWTKELGDQRIKELIDAVQKVSGYEVV